MQTTSYIPHGDTTLLLIRRKMHLRLVPRVQETTILCQDGLVIIDAKVQGANHCAIESGLNSFEVNLHWNVKYPENRPSVLQRLPWRRWTLLIKEVAKDIQSNELWNWYFEMTTQWTVSEMPKHVTYYYRGLARMSAKYTDAVKEHGKTPDEFTD